MVLFAHDIDIEYATIVENEKPNSPDNPLKLINLFNDCQSIEDIENLRLNHPNHIPKLISSHTPANGALPPL